MDSIVGLQIYILAFLMLVTIFIKMETEMINRLMPNRLFKFYILSALALLLLDVLSLVLDGYPGQTVRIGMIVLNMLLMIGCMVPMIVYLCYLASYSHGNTQRIRKLLPFCATLWILNAALVATSPFTRLYFYLDAANVYQRGGGMVLLAGFYLILLFIGTVLIFLDRKRVAKKDAILLYLPLFLPIVGFFVQIVTVGLYTTSIGVSLSILIMFLTTQSKLIKIDYLTGLYNRRQLDGYLRTRLHGIGAEQRFAGIMLDIDHFKKINDDFGHIVGDRAIEMTGSILKGFFKKNEFIARYAGDEFVILFELEEGESLEQKAKKLQKQFALFNDRGKEPFRLEVSLGYAIYEKGDGMNADGFLRQLDRLMYIDKMSKKEKKEQAPQPVTV